MNRADKLYMVDFLLGTGRVTSDVDYSKTVMAGIDPGWHLGTTDPMPLNPRPKKGDILARKCSKCQNTDCVRYMGDSRIFCRLCGKEGPYQPK